LSQQSFAALLVVKVRRIHDAAAYVKLANESVNLETIKSAVAGFVFSMRNDDVDVLLVIFDCSMIIEITKPEERGFASIMD
jgi:hypothetical protein